MARIRVRTMGSLNTPIYKQFTTYPQSCADRTEDNPAYGTISVSGEPIYVGDTKTTTDVIDADYWKRKKRGDIIINYFQSVRKQREVFGQTAIVQTSILDACTGPSIKQIYRYKIHKGLDYLFAAELYSWRNLLPTVPVDEKRLRTEIITKCLADRQKGMSNLVESLAELDKTIGMVRHPLENVISFLRTFRKKGRRNRDGTPQTNADLKNQAVFLSSEWLRFRYGISPLISDVKSVLKVLRKRYNQVEVQLVKARASGQDIANTFKSGTANSGAEFIIPYTYSRAHTFSVRAVFYDKYRPDPFNDLGLTFHNLIGVPWELTHYSFVVDWFANFGDLMYANLPRVGVIPCGGSVTTRKIVTGVIACNGLSDNNSGDGWIFTGSASSGYRMTDTTTERGGFGVGDSGLVVNHDFRADNWIRVTDAVSLISQLLGSISFYKH